MHLHTQWQNVSALDYTCTCSSTCLGSVPSHNQIIVFLSKTLPFFDQAVVVQRLDKATFLYMYRMYPITCKHRP